MTDEQFEKMVSEYPMNNVFGAMNEYAWLIAEKAIHEVSNEYTFTTAFETRAVTLFGNEIISRIKQLTEE